MSRRTVGSQVLQDLIAQAATGDRGAQEALMQHYWPLITQAVRARKNRLGGPAMAKEQTVDLQQTAALKVLSELGKHRWQGQSAFTAWVRKLADLEVIDTYRHHHAQKRDAAAEVPADGVLELTAPARSAESRMDDHARVNSLLAQVRQLKEEYGAALIMSHMGFTHAEIGETLDCTPEAARKLVSRARVKLVALQGEDP